MQCRRSKHVFGLSNLKWSTQELPLNISKFALLKQIVVVKKMLQFLSKVALTTALFPEKDIDVKYQVSPLSMH